MPRGRESAPTNRSKAIRDYLAKNAQATGSQIKEALAKQGVEVSHSLIGAVKAKGRKTKRGRKRGRRAGTNGRAGASVSLQSLLAAKQLAERVGGVEKAAAALAVLGRLGG